MADDPNDEKLSVEHRAALMLVDDLKSLPSMLKAMSGRQPGIQDLTPDNELWAWNYVDESAIPDAIKMRAEQKPDVEIAARVFPLRRRLVEQGGVTYQEQERRAITLAERAMKARASGRVPKPPPRPDGSL